MRENDVATQSLDLGVQRFLIGAVAACSTFSSSAINSAARRGRGALSSDIRQRLPGKFQCSGDCTVIGPLTFQHDLRRTEHRWATAERELSVLNATPSERISSPAIEVHGLPCISDKATSFT